MLSLICPDRFVRGNDGANHTDSHLRTQPEGLPARLVRGFLYMKNVQGNMALMHIFRDICAGSRISLHRIKQELSVRRLWEELQFCGQCLLHGKRPFFIHIIAHLFENRRAK